MSKKLEQMNIRLSEKLKEKIEELAKKNDLKTSDFVRQTLEEAIEEKNKISVDNLNITNFSSRERYMLQAVAFIAHTDTGKPLVDCLKIALQVAEEQQIKDLADPTKMSREEREKQALRINTIVSERLQVSSQAITYIRLMLVTFFGIVFNQEIFQMTPLAMVTMEEIKNQLDKAKS